MKKFMKNIKSNAGVSLTELIIGMALLSIFVVTVGGLLTNVTRLQTRIIDLTELSTLSDTLSNSIVKELNNAFAPIGFCNYDSATANFCGCTTGCDPSDITVGCLSAMPCPVSCAGDGADRFTVLISGIGNVEYSVDADGALFKSCDSPQCIALGILDCPGHPVLAIEYYKSRRMTFTLEPATVGTGVAYLLTVTLTTNEDDPAERRELTTRQYAVRPFTLNQFTP
ncbi:MAG: hypothetical protein FWD48_08000 [Oscillospiraceae bacterium]|nr:hypothetical protein [Oscillospiraceae bacterium]